MRITARLLFLFSLAWSAQAQTSYTAASPPPRLVTPFLGTKGQFQFSISGVTPGRTNLVQSSLNLSNWTSISTNVAVSNSLQVIDSTATNAAQHFYRTLEIH